jgi:phosphate transport system protein
VDSHPAGRAPHRGRLDEIDGFVASMFTEIPGRLAVTTAAFLRGDRKAAQRVVAADEAIDFLQNDVEDLVTQELLSRPCDEAEIRYLVTVLRIVPELERSGDLVEHIALRTNPMIMSSLTPRAKELIDAMGTTAAAMWRDAAGAYRARDLSAAERLRTEDDDLDSLHVELCDEFASGVLSPSLAIELGLVARFLERLGDHAVNVTRRLAYLTLDVPVR